MKKMVSSLVMASALLLGATAPVVANAASTPTSADTTAKATFTANTSTVTPVDPEDPNTELPTDPKDPGNVAEPGAGLSLIYAPATLDFGSHEIDTLSDQSYNAKNDGTILMPVADATDPENVVSKAGTKVGLQVSDQRGVNTGWTLSAKSTNLASTDGTALDGASISFLSTGVTSSGKTQAGSNAYTAGNGATSSTSNLKLATDNSTTVFASAKAADGTGAGVTVLQWTPENVQLNVDANSAKSATYTGTISWSLSDTPGA